MNNCLSNLRLATAQEQKLNLGPKRGGRVNVRGVSYNKQDNTYIVDMRVRGLRYYCRHFQTVEEAVFARYIFERELIGEYSLVQSTRYMNPYIERLTPEKKAEIEPYIISLIERKRTECSTVKDTQ